MTPGVRIKKYYPQIGGEFADGRMSLNKDADGLIGHADSLVQVLTSTQLVESCSQRNTKIVE
jgi:hypothetical protein